MGSQRVDLTDQEWMSIIDSERDGLPICCANVSELRSVLITVARNSGELFSTGTLTRHLGHVFPGHGEPSPVLQKIIDQLGIEIPEHAPNNGEVRF